MKPKKTLFSAFRLRLLCFLKKIYRILQGKKRERIFITKMNKKESNGRYQRHGTLLDAANFSNLSG